MGWLLAFAIENIILKQTKKKENIILNFREEKSKAQKAHMKNGANI